MRKTLPLLLLCGLFLLYGCSASITPPAPPPNFSNLSENATQMAAVTPYITPDDLLITTPALDTTQEFQKELIFRDDFDRGLGTGWFWQNEEPTGWSMDAVPGTLQINAAAGYVNLKNAKNVLLRPVPEGDFMAEVSMLFNPDENDQIAGLLLYESSRDFIQAGLGYCLPELGCAGNSIIVDIYRNGKLTLPRNIINYKENTLVARLIRKGDTASLFISSDGTAWYRGGEYQINFTPQYIGLIAAQNAEILPLPATFAYFEISVPK